MRNQKPYPKLLTEIIAGLLVFLFLYTSLSKLSNIKFFSNQLHQFPFIRNFSGIIAWLIPLSELFAVGLLLTPKYLLQGFYFSLVLLSMFTIYLFLMLLIKHENLPCSCGGVLKYLSWGQHIVFNLFFIILTLAGTWIEKKNEDYQFSQLHH